MRPNVCRSVRSGLCRPRGPGLRSGHMPGAKNLPADRFAVDGRLKDVEELRDIFEAVFLSPDRPAITSCGSGVTAAIISLALESVGHRDHALYDGSWAEWGGRDDTPIVTGA